MYISTHLFLVIPLIVGSLSEAKTIEGQKKAISSLILAKSWEKLEKECVQTDFINSRAIMNLLISEAQENPLCLIIICERYGYHEELVNFLIRSSSIDTLLSYLMHIREGMTCNALRKMLESEMDPFPLLNSRLVLSNYELLLSCSEMLLSMKKYDIGVRWASCNLDTFSECPLLSTILGHCLIASDGSISMFKALENADFCQLVNVSRSLQRHEFELICSWKTNDFSRLLETWEKLSDHKALLDLILDNDQSHFEAFWTKVSKCERLQNSLSHALALKSVLGVLVEKMGVGYTNFIRRLIKLDMALFFQDHFMTIVEKSLGDVSKVAAVELISFVLLYRKDNWELVAGYVARNDLAKKCIDCLLDLERFEEASFLLQIIGDYKTSIHLLLYKVCDPDKAINLVKTLDEQYAWKILGEFLIETGQLSNQILCESLVKGNVFLGLEDLLKCEKFMDTKEFRSYIEFGWKNGHQTSYTANYLGQYYLKESRVDAIDKLIDTCTSSTIVSFNFDTRYENWGSFVFIARNSNLH